MPTPDVFDKLLKLPAGKRVPVGADGQPDFARGDHEEGGKYLLFKELPIIKQVLTAIVTKLRRLLFVSEDQGIHLQRLTNTLLENTTTDLVNGVGSGMDFTLRFPARDFTSVEVFAADGSAEGLLTEDTHFSHTSKTNSGRVLPGYTYTGKKLRVTYRRSGF